MQADAGSSAGGPNWNAIAVGPPGLCPAEHGRCKPTPARAPAVRIGARSRLERRASARLNTDDARRCRLERRRSELDRTAGDWSRPAERVTDATRDGEEALLEALTLLESARDTPGVEDGEDD